MVELPVDYPDPLMIEGDEPPSEHPRLSAEPLLTVSSGHGFLAQQARLQLLVSAYFTTQCTERPSRFNFSLTLSPNTCRGGSTRTRDVIVS